MLATVEAKIGEFIVEHLGYEGSLEDLIGSRPAELPDILDSEEVLELVTWVEIEFDAEIEDDEITHENFLTVPRIATYLATKAAVRD